MKRVALFCNLLKAGVPNVVQSLVRIEGAEFGLEPDDAASLGLESLAREAPWFASCDVAVSLGGDGTCVRTARAVAAGGALILAVNFGRFGFLAESEPSDATAALRDCLRGDCAVRERMMADCAVTRSDETVAQFLALNDFAITNGAVSRNFPVRCSTNECLIGEFEGNGVLISTPTGCTAYSLAAGGPLVAPELDSLLLTPICPHTIGNRSIVLPGDTVISLTVLDDHESPVVLTVDGQTGTSLGSGETVVISQAKCRARFVARSEEDFYSRVRRKFGWGTRHEAR